MPFLKFVANKGTHDEAANYSFVLRGYVRHWLANVWSEFDRIKLTDIVGAKPGARSPAKNKSHPAMERRRIRRIVACGDATARPFISSARRDRWSARRCSRGCLSEFLLLKHGDVTAFDINPERTVAARLSCRS